MPARSTPASSFFEALERRRTQALVQRDLGTIEALHAPEYELITPSGAVFSRSRYVETIAREPFYTFWEVTEFRVRAATEMAVVRYQATLGFPSGRQLRVWHTDMYQCISGRWQAVWSQATEIAASKELPRAA
ncbi:MAG: nuclear transport factor 2 family protein [Rubrivivax sp.]|nr:nuclear transport factor 2 family protein [Rubrivivax sp.]